MAEKIVCEMCNKKIRFFKNRNDWENRPMHLKCWKESQENMKMNFMYEDFLKEENLKKLKSD
jgi:hypothetical protein